MLVVLLPNLDFLSLTEFYNEAVESCTPIMFPLDDPRQQGVSEILLYQ